MISKLFSDSRHRQILDIALPSIVSNITVPLLGLIDVGIVGHLGDSAYIGAIAVGSMAFNVIYWLFAFLRMGTSGMTSQALGARKLTEVCSILVSTISVCVSIALVFIALQVPIRNLALWLMNTTGDIHSLASTYFDICIWGAPAVMALFGLNGWFIGMQNSRIPMIVAVSQNVINIIASMILVFGMGMKIEGVALGTVIAQYSGCLIAVVLLLVNYSRIGKYFSRKNIFEKRMMKRMFTVNRDIFLRTLFLVSVNLFFTSAGSLQGKEILSVNTLLMQLFLLYSYTMDGFAFAGEALCGKAYGAANKIAFADTIKKVMAWGVALSLLYTLVYCLLGKYILQILTDNPDVLALSANYLPWAMAFPFAGLLAFVYDGVFIGCTKTKGMLLSTLFGAIAFFGLYFGLRTTMGNHGLWLSFVAFLLARGLTLHFILRNKNF